MQKEEFSDGSGLQEYDFGARFYDVQLGRWKGIDAHADRYYPWSPYSYTGNNPTNLVDLDGKDWFQDKEENIIWNNSRENELIKDGVEYRNIGSTLTFYVNSYIPEGHDLLMPFADGKKLTNIYSITGNYDKDGKFSGFSTKFDRRTGKSFGLFQGQDKVEGQVNQNGYIKQLSDGTYVGGFEQHTTLNKVILWGMQALHGRAVDVAQDLRLTIDNSGKLKVDIMHGTYPSVEMRVNEQEVYDFWEHSFIFSHSMTMEHDPSNTVIANDAQRRSDEMNTIFRSLQAPYIHFAGFSSAPVDPRTYSKIPW
ncbi:MAG: hypothetical protein J0H74_24025 [Chitinophagaceae bacterium]|nr:hypothetical protein [Chitinophagaceae bacterium]